MTRSLALLVSGLLLVSCKTVSRDKRSHRVATPTSDDGNLPPDTNTIKDTTSTPVVETVMTPTPAAGRKLVTAMEGKLWALPQNAVTYNALPNDAVDAIWNVGMNIYTIHQGVGLGISTDGGQTWVTKTVANGLGSTAVFDVYAQGSSIFVATDNGISISQDGGTTWVLAAPGESYTRIVATLDRIYAVGATVMRVSADQGKSWTLTSLPSGNCVTQMVGRGTKLYAAQNCEGGRLWISSDEGKNWEVLGGNVLQSGINDVLFWKGQILAATNAGLYVSNDNGVGWTLSTLAGKISVLGGVATSLYATLVEDNKEILYSSTDDGKTWGPDKSTLPLAPRVKGFGDAAFAVGGLGLQHVRGAGLRSAKSNGALVPGILSSLTVVDNVIYTAGQAGVAYSTNSESWTAAAPVVNEIFKTDIGKLHVTPAGWYVPSPTKGLFVSTDMGKTWSVKTGEGLTETSAPLAIASTGSKFAILTETNLLLSQDSITWTSVAFPTQVRPGFLKKSAGRFYMAHFGTFLASSNEGVNWAPFKIDLLITDVAYSDGRYYASTSKGFSYSTDQVTWKTSTDPVWTQANFCRSVEALDKTVLVGCNKGVFISEDKGLTFVFYPLGQITGIGFQGTTAYIATTQAVFVYKPTIKMR